jgi:hypothetical protein
MNKPAPMRGVFLFCSVFAAIDLSAQIVVPEATKSFYGIVEATWCGNCGQYGHPATADIIDQCGSKAIYLGLHKSLSSELYSSTASDLATSFGAIGQPFFTVNAQALGAYSATIVAETVSAIDGYYNATAADVNAGFEYGIVGDTLYVHTRTTFFTSQSGDYYTAVYVYEDSVWAWQANYDPGIADMDIWHNHILRTSLNGHFGAEVATGTQNAGTSVNRNFKVKLDPSWDPAQLHVVTVVWKKNGTLFEFVNANDVGSVITGQVGVEESGESEITLYPNPVSDTFYMSGLDPLEANADVYDLNGNLVMSFQGQDHFNVHFLPPGIYTVRITCGDHVLVRRIVKA